MPIAVFTMITKPNRPSWMGPTARMIANSTPMIALKRVRTLARTISPRLRLVAAAGARRDVVAVAARHPLRYLRTGETAPDVDLGEHAALGGGHRPSLAAISAPLGRSDAPNAAFAAPASTRQRQRGRAAADLA